MTARDVKFSFERVVKLNSPMKPHWELLDRVELEDDYTGVIVFKRPDAAVWLVPLPHAAGQIVSEEAVLRANKDGGDFGMKPPAFSGPYVLADWKPNQYTILTRNPDWSGLRPGFDEIRIFPIPDVKAAERAYQAGDVDLTSISVESLASFRSNPPPGSEIVQKPSTGYVWVGINMDHPKLKDINVRKAIQWAIDVPQILDVAYAGQAVLATGTVPPELSDIVRRRSSRRKAIAKAKEFMEKAGVTDLTLSIDCLNDSTSSTIAQTVQAQLSQIGISLEVQPEIPVRSGRSEWNRKETTGRMCSYSS
ncbi:ABC transporter substrate-binding protein [Aminobacter sp. BA135]|uniref:ABC transporter substrate-binding protein n=1 Tax=Aminobacter sp. BA135 TaxID=537596 RepID=UPI003D795C92